MALRLTIISEQGPLLGDSASIVFGVGGGRIGRAHDNDWVLPDPQRYVSAHHARVLFRDGQYLLEDCSTNGVFINDSTAPVRRHGPAPLHDGDVLRLGGYRITATIDATETPAQVDASSIIAFDTGPSTGTVRRAGGPPLDLNELLVPERTGGSSARLRVPAAVAVASSTEDSGLRNFDLSQASRAESPTAPDLRREISRPLNLNTTDATSAVELFCRGAGIAPERLPGNVAARVLFLGGLLLREALVGLKDLALAQQDVRDGLQITTTAEDGTERIPLRNLAVEDLLLKLIVGHEQREVDAVQWLRDTIASARRHDAATAAALGTALAEFIPHLRPDAASGPAVKARFRNITASPGGGGLPHLYQEAFVRAFLAAFAPGGGAR